MATQLADFLPASPAEGPPLPRFMGVRWSGKKSALPKTGIKDAVVLFPQEKPPGQALAIKPSIQTPVSEKVPLVFE